MSKLIELLDKTQETSPGLGFAASRQAAAAPSIALLGRAAAGEITDAPDAASAADAALVTLDASHAALVKRVGGALKGRLWGARVGAVAAADAQALKDAGCDFIVFDAEDTEAAVLNDADIGKIIAVDPDDPDFDEDSAKAIRSLDIDAALIASSESLLPLTVQRLLGLQAARALIGRRCILAAPAELSKADVETLRNAGVVGLAISLAAPEDAARVKADIAALPRRKSQRGGGGRGASAKAPSAGFLQPSAPDREDDYDDDYDDYDGEE